jgi:serine/threonine-protein kinase
VTVPNIVHRTPDEGTEILVASGLILGRRSTAPVAEEKVGLITSQEPQAGSQVLRGTAVDIFVGRADEVTVPNVIGRTKRLATLSLGRARLVVGKVTTVRVPSPDQDGLVLDQDPKSGSVVPRGSAVDIDVGDLLEVAVPDVVGLKLGEAQAKLQEAGFRVGKVTQTPVGPDRAGIVLGQDPEAGTRVPAGSSVNMQAGAVRVFGFNDVVARAEEKMLAQGVIADAQPGFLHKRLQDVGMDTVAKLQEFLTLDPREIRDTLGFRNLPITRSMIAAFKEIFESG